MGGKSLICVPINYEREALGILAVDNIKSKMPLKKSDMNLLMGIASQLANSIMNAMSFKKLQGSENKYRNRKQHHLADGHARSHNLFQ
jgi:GAF domain-containing protein